MVKIGIIGGSGLENPGILSVTSEISGVNRYGSPSSSLLTGKINDVSIILLSRHGRQHTIPPSQVNNRANIFALKEAGCTHIIATTACGSLRENIKRGDLVVPDQFIDFTRRRETTFFEEFLPGEMKHTPMANPFDKDIRSLLISKGRELGLMIHPKGTVITIEGPRFSTRAESLMFRSWGADIINMSTAPEAILANEAGIPYAVVAMSTDYDCWKTDEEPVSWERVIEVFNENVHNVIRLIQNILPEIGKQ